MWSIKSTTNSSQQKVALTAEEYHALRHKLLGSGPGGGIKARFDGSGPGTWYLNLLGGALFCATAMLAMGEANFGPGINSTGTAALLSIEAAIVAAPWVVRGLMHLPRKNAVQKLETALASNQRPTGRFFGLRALPPTLTRA